MSENPAMTLRKTKIIVTLGQSSSSKEILIELIEAGMDIARISDRFIKQDKSEILANLREAMKVTGKEVGIMVSLRESDIRIGTYSDSPVQLKKGEIVSIANKGNKNCGLWCNNKDLFTNTQPGDKLLVDFGKIILTVLDKPISVSRSQSDLKICSYDCEPDSSKIGNTMFLLNSSSPIFSRKGRYSLSGEFQRLKRQPKVNKISKELICRVENDCMISVHKPVHICSSAQNEANFSDGTISEDFKLIEWANNNDIDFIVIRHVSTWEDLDFLLNLINPSIKKIFGLQNKKSVELFENLINRSDAVVVGRGTLALETSLADVCKTQKKVVKRCNELGKPVIISTQLLENMVINKQPTRSEVTDVTNAVLDGADALVLTGETAYGEDPVGALKFCIKICQEAEKFLKYSEQCRKIKKIIGKNITITENTCYSAVTTVLSINAKAIVCLTESGSTAQIISRFLPPCPIVALTNSQKTERHMKVIRGVFPFYVQELNEENLLQTIYHLIKHNNFGQTDDHVVLVGGLSFSFEGGNTCSMRIVRVR